jgi:hypothetical protein
VLVARVIFFALLSAGEILVAHMPQFVPVVCFAVVGILLAAGG